MQFILWGNMNVCTEFHNKTDGRCEWRKREKSPGIVRVVSIRPLGTMNCKTKYCGNPPGSSS